MNFGQNVKNRVLGAILALLVLADLSHAVPSNAYACSPAPLPDLQTAQNNADVIFIGKVVAVDNSPFAVISAFLSDTGQRRVLFNITSIWKGPVISQAVVGVENRLCGYSRYDFYKDEGLLVFASNVAPSSLEARLLSRTRELEGAMEDLEVLGEGKSPMEQADLGTLFSFQSYWAEVVFSIFLIVAIFGVIRAYKG